MFRGVFQALQCVGLLIVALPAHATMYRLMPDEDVYYMEASSVMVTLETSARGEYTDEATIEAVLNASGYSVSLMRISDVLASMSESNSSWDLRLGQSVNGIPSSARLLVGEARVTLTFETIDELSDARLFLFRDSDYGAPFNLQFSQTNNITDYNFADIDYNAVHHARVALPYTSSFVFTAVDSPVSVPEPMSGALLFTGLGLLVVCSRARAVRRTATAL